MTTDSKVCFVPLELIVKGEVCEKCVLKSSTLLSENKDFTGHFTHSFQELSTAFLTEMYSFFKVTLFCD